MASPATLGASVHLDLVAARGKGGAGARAAERGLCASVHRCASNYSSFRNWRFAAARCGKMGGARVVPLPCTRGGDERAPRTARRASDRAHRAPKQFPLCRCARLAIRGVSFDRACAASGSGGGCFPSWPPDAGRRPRQPKPDPVRSVRERKRSRAEACVNAVASGLFGENFHRGGSVAAASRAAIFAPSFRRNLHPRGRTKRRRRGEGERSADGADGGAAARVPSIGSDLWETFGTLDVLGSACDRIDRDASGGARARGDVCGPGGSLRVALLPFFFPPRVRAG